MLGILAGKIEENVVFVSYEQLVAEDKFVALNLSSTEFSVYLLQENTLAKTEKKTIWSDLMSVVFQRPD